MEAIIGTFTAGLLSFASPCVLPMVPLIVGYILGENGKEKSKLFTKMITFSIGFILVFTVIGALVTTFGKFINQNIHYVNIIAGLIIILMGINYTGIIKSDIFTKQFKLEKKKRYKLEHIDSFIFGMFFALAWGPCTGPFLAYAMAAAANSNTIILGISLLIVYALGIVIPLFLSAVFVSEFKNIFKGIKKNYDKINLVSGILLILTGIYLIVNSAQVIYKLWNG